MNVDVMALCSLSARYVTLVNSIRFAVLLKSNVNLTGFTAFKFRMTMGGLITTDVPVHTCAGMRRAIDTNAWSESPRLCTVIQVTGVLDTSRATMSSV